MKRYIKRYLVLFLACVMAISMSSSVYAGAVKGHGYKVYVSKMNKTVTLYHYGQAVDTWPCNLGTYSSEGDKKQEGDSTTPSGSFYVCTRNDHSVAYLSLGLSYPSTEDADRGYKDGIINAEQRDAIKTAISKGQQPPWDTGLGGAIMIHGGYTEGGTTHGCVAVDNSVMDILWQYCELGMPVDVGP